MKNSSRSNFDMLRHYEEQLWRLGALAECIVASCTAASALLARIALANTSVAGKYRQKVPLAQKKRAQAAMKL